jgi:hypothetical protein
MATPTLGYEADTEISKIEMARIQLDESINLFLSGKFLCALTLAGAAEEILAGLLRVQGLASAVERSADAIQQIRVVQALAASPALVKSPFREWNAARNAAKHHGGNDGETVVLNLFDESYWMIERGLTNARSLGLSVCNEIDFRNWIVLNINM